MHHCHSHILFISAHSQYKKDKTRFFDYLLQTQKDIFFLKLLSLFSTTHLKSLPNKIPEQDNSTPQVRNTGSLKFGWMNEATWKWWRKVRVPEANQMGGGFHAGGVLKWSFHGRRKQALINQLVVLSMTL